MDFTSVIGIVAAFILMVFGIGLGSLSNFWDPSSVLITLGGTIAVLVASFPVRVLKEIPKHLKILVSGSKKNDPVKYIETISEFAQVARKNGLLALEELANNEEDPFLRESVLLIVDAIDADKVRTMLEAKLENIDARHAEAISFYQRGAAFGPAFGMIGTLIGLINMLKGLDASSADASKVLGDGMSVALVTTFYGSVIANVIFQPIANKLGSRNDEEMLCKSIIMEGVLSIQSGENPKFITEKLNSLLQQKTREQEEAKGKKSRKKKADTQ